MQLDITSHGNLPCLDNSRKLIRPLRRQGFDTSVALVHVQSDGSMSVWHQTSSPDLPSMSCRMSTVAAGYNHRFGYRKMCAYSELWLYAV